MDGSSSQSFVACFMGIEMATVSRSCIPNPPSHFGEYNLGPRDPISTIPIPK